ncbi:PucR family transcriptional regulator [Amycolatopsis ultiminotia]|uniref:PucR family transcriptional regulator n=1 Tax=Amycolatopsis ultiminotia TaxID=543629 RepID=UPI0031EEFE22
MNPKDLDGTTEGRPMPVRSALADSILDRVIAEVPFYRTLPHELLIHDAYSIVQQNVDIVLDALRERRVPDREKFSPAKESARRRAEEGVPLPELLDAYAIGVRAVWDSVAEQEADPAELRELTAVLFGALRQACSEVAAGYLTGHETSTQDRRELEHSMISALLDGRGAEVASGLALQLPAYYLVASLAFGRHPDELATDLDTTVATHRKIRRIRDALHWHGREGTLSSITATGGLALVPQPAWTGSERDWAGARALVGHLERSAGTHVVAALAVTAPGEVPDAVAETREVLTVVQEFRHPPGTYRLQDVLVEYQLTRPSAATEHLAALLAPLDGHPALLETLQTFMRGGGNRRATATRLHLHPNSVDYRLHRVHQLTGLDPTELEDTQRIAAALAARRAVPRRAG